MCVRTIYTFQLKPIYSEKNN